MQACEFLPGKPCSLAAGTDACPEKAFVGIDVADTMQQGLVKQCCFDRRFSATKECLEIGEANVEGLDTAAGERLKRPGQGGWRRRGVKAHASEAPRIDKTQFAAGA